MSQKEIYSPVTINKSVVSAEDVKLEEIPMKKLEEGDFDGLKELLTGKDRAKYIESLLKGLNNTIAESKKEAVELRERGFFGRLKSNNVNDIGAVLSKQSVAIACLYLLMQMQSFSIGECKDMLVALHKEFDKISEESTDQSSVITQTFKGVIEGYKKRLEKEGVRDKALMKLLKAAENSKDFEADIRAELEKAKSEYSSTIDELKSHHEALELMNRHLKYTIYAFLIIITVLLIGIIASFLI